MAKLVLLLTLISSSCLLSSSSFFLFDYLEYKFASESLRERTLLFALKINHPSALNFEQAQNKVGSDTWLLLNKILAKNNSQAALRLASWYYQKFTDLGTDHTKTQIIMWLKQAIRLGSIKASFLLGKFHYEQGNYQQANQILSQVPDRVESQYLRSKLLQLTIKVVVALGDIDRVKYLLSKVADNYLNNKPFNKLLEDIKNYQVINTAPLEKVISSSDDNFIRGDTNTCLISIQLFATTFVHLSHIDKLLDNFFREKTLSYYTCFPKPRYINVNILNCQTKIEQAIICDEAIFKNIVDSTTTQYIGLMAEEGGANVHFGILYFDKNDHINVLSHEISHLLGFVDEYPLSPQHQTCQGIQRKTFAHNIAVIPSTYTGDRQVIRNKVLSSIAWGSLIADTTPVLQRVTNNFDTLFDKNIMSITWKVGTPDMYKHVLGIFPAETCNNALIVETLPFKNAVDFNAYKPLKEYTHLQYSSYDFPKHYENILALAPKAYIMPSFHYNIALATQYYDKKR
jgi:hypothetical protein